MGADDRRPPETEGLPDAVLEEVNRMWTVVRALTNAAHEVNNALQVISGSAELLETQGLPPQAAKRVAAIRTEAAKAAATIEQLATYARGDGGAPRPVDVGALVERAVTMQSSSVRRLRIGLTLDLRAAGPCWAVLDSNLALQTLLDLFLAAEERAKSLTDARIVVSLEGTARTVSVSIRAEGTERASGESAGDITADTTPDMTPVEAITSGAQLWTAVRLAAVQEGSVQLEEGPGLAVFTLTVPAYEGPQRA